MELGLQLSCTLHGPGFESQQVLGAEAVRSFYSGITVFFPGVKRPGRDVDYSPPSSSEFVELYLCFHIILSWRGQGNFTCFTSNYFKT
jgi:hypothetical protein